MITVTQCEDGEMSSSLRMHPALFSLIHKYRRLVDDPGTLELLCRIHHQVERRSASKNLFSGEHYWDSRFAKEMEMLMVYD